VFLHPFPFLFRFSSMEILPFVFTYAIALVAVQALGIPRPRYN
jgi:hypothetical protein